MGQLSFQIEFLRNDRKKFRRPFQRPQVSKGQRPLVAPRTARNLERSAESKGCKPLAAARKPRNFSESAYGLKQAAKFL